MIFRQYSTKGYLETTSIIDYESFKHYRSSSKYRDVNNTPNYVEHGKILSKFYEKVAEKLTTKSGGVFIEKLGYFSGVVDIHKTYKAYPKQKSINLNRATSGYKFYLTFVPISKTKKLMEWTADGSFAPNVKKAFSNALKNGVKFTYNPYYFICKYSKKQKR